MNRCVIEWPKGMDLKLAILGERAVVRGKLFCVAPARIRYEPANGLLESIPLMDPVVEDSDESSDGDESSDDDVNVAIAEQQDQVADADNEAIVDANADDADDDDDDESDASEADSMDVDENEFESDEDDPDFIQIMEIVYIEDPFN